MQNFVHQTRGILIFEWFYYLFLLFCKSRRISRVVILHCKKIQYRIREQNITVIPKISVLKQKKINIVIS